MMMMMKLLPSTLSRQLALTLFTAALATASIAAPDNSPRERGGDRSAERGDRSGDRGAQRGGERSGDRDGRGHRDGRADGDNRVDRGDRDHRPDHRNDRDHRPGTPPRGDWFDGRHGHNHRYPTPGWSVGTLPRHSNFISWSGVNYRFYDGIWYTPGARGYVVVRPPIGIVVHDLPAFRTVLTIGGLAYLYANSVYYRERAEGGYEVVPQPMATPDSAPPDRMFVYPRQGQTAQQQGSDEYDCHQWAVSQSSFDPTAAAVGQPGSSPARRIDYQRAQSACLEGRGYTVR